MSLESVLKNAVTAARAAVLGGSVTPGFRQGRADTEPRPDYCYGWRFWKRNASLPFGEDPILDAVACRRLDPGSPGYDEHLPYAVDAPAYTDDPAALPKDDDDDMMRWARWASSGLHLPDTPYVHVDVRAMGMPAFVAVNWVPGEGDSASTGELIGITVSCGGVPLGALTVTVDVEDTRDNGGEAGRVTVSCQRQVVAGSAPPPPEMAALRDRVLAELGSLPLPLEDLQTHIRERRLRAVSL